MKRGWLVLLLLSTSLSAGEVWRGTTRGDFAAEIELSQSELTVADGLDLVLRLSAPQGYHIDLSSVRNGINAAHEMISIEREEIGPERYADDGLVTQELHYRLEPWIDGEGVVAFLPLRWISESGNGVELYSGPLLFHVSLKESGANPDDLVAGLLPLEIKPQIELSRENRQQLAAGAEIEKERREQLRKKRRLPWYGMGALLLLALLIWTLSRLRPLLKRTLRGREERLDPRRQALRLLQQLEAEHLPEQRLFDPFYVRLTRIVRHYIEERFELRAPERTTQEFLSELVSQPHFDSSMQQLLSSFLLEADLVKFAKVEPTHGQCQGAVEAARKVIEYHSAT